MFLQNLMTIHHSCWNIFQSTPKWWICSLKIQIKMCKHQNSSSSWWLFKTCSAWVREAMKDSVRQRGVCVCVSLKCVCVCALLRFLPPLSEASVGAASGDGSASTPEIYDTLCTQSKPGGSAEVAYIMLSNWDGPERKQLHCNSSQALNL